MDYFLQGATPTLHISLPTGIEYENIPELELTIQNGSTIYKKYLEDMIYDENEHRISYKFTQDETLSMNVDSPVYIQIRYKTNDGSVFGTTIKECRVKKSLSRDVI